MFRFRRMLFVTMAVLISLATSRIAAAQDMSWTGNANLFLGAKALEEDDWAPADEQSEAGLKLDFRQKDWPISIAVDLLTASGDGRLYDPVLGASADLESKTSELHVGVRKIWEGFPHVRPFLGGGMSFIRAEAEARALGVTVSDSDTGVGAWLEGGVYWTLSGHLNLGLELMSSYAKVSLFGVDVDAGGGHFGVFAGYHW